MTRRVAHLGVSAFDGFIRSFFGIFPFPLAVVGATDSDEVDVAMRGTPVVAEEAAGLMVVSEPAAEETVFSHRCAGFFVARTSSAYMQQARGSCTQTFLLLFGRICYHRFSGRFACPR